MDLSAHRALTARWRSGFSSGKFSLRFTDNVLRVKAARGTSKGKTHCSEKSEEEEEEEEGGINSSRSDLPAAGY